MSLNKYFVVAFVILAALALLFFEARESSEVDLPVLSTTDVRGSVETLFRDSVSGESVVFSGKVDRLLPDDISGSRHQRFIVMTPTGHTVLVSHNIDLATRAPVVLNENVSIRGDFEWNEQGGVVHWTHHDPAGRRQGGWVEINGKRYR